METLIIRCLCFDFQGLDTAEGLLLFGKEHFYILDGFTLVNGREVHDIDLMPANYYEPIIPVVPGQVFPLTPFSPVLLRFRNSAMRKTNWNGYLSVVSFISSSSLQ